MSIISGDMDPKAPTWLDEANSILEELGYSHVGSSNEYARRTNEVGMEFLKLQMNDPEEALKAIPDYLRRFSDINRDAGILNSLIDEQFGLIINIATRQYDPDSDETRAYYLYSQVDDYLSDKRSDQIGSFTSQLRNPKLIRDLAAHWEAVNWPHAGNYAHFLSKTTGWEEVNQQIGLRENNPVMFAITIPLASTDPLIQTRYQETYPDSSQDGIDIIAARLFNKGAHRQHLREIYPENANRYPEWEAMVYDALQIYSETYHEDILAAITKADWHVYDDKKFNFPGLPELLLQTSFSLSEDGRLVRQPAKS